MSVDIIIPAGGECVYRASARSWLASRWEPFNVIVGVCEGPWSKAVAVEDALTRSTADVIVVHDGDSWSEATRQVALEVESGQARWGVPFTTVHRLDKESTQRVLAGDIEPHAGRLIKPPHRMVPGGGITVLTRELYEEAPLDHRFRGWGYEDECWGLALRLLAGAPLVHGAKLWHLWHPPADRAEFKRESLYVRNLYTRARRRPAAMRDLLKGARP